MTMKHLGPEQARSATLLLRTYRSEADDRVGSRCDVVGSMIGMKIRSDQVLPRPCLTYFVREKAPMEDIAPRQRIPARMRLGGQMIPTDVLVWPRMELHSLAQGRFIRDGFTQGTLTAFARSPYGLWGLSCGHCMLGPDQKPYTSTDVMMHDANLRQFISAGTTAQTLFSAGGPQIGGTRGYLDCGIFSLHEDSLRKRAEEAPELRTADLQSLAYQQLTGVSVMAVEGQVGGPRLATVIGIDKYGIDDFCDVVLRAESPGMTHGDSGMLWLTQDGLAAAIHCRGEVVNKKSGSRLITAMSAQRAAEVLGVTLRMA